MKKLKLLFTVLCVLCGTVSFAHDFEVSGIYYNILSKTDKTVEVTFRGKSNSQYSNEYTGSVVIPENVTYNGTTYSVTGIENITFVGCSGLTSITIPNGVTSIGGWAFYLCDGLTSITIPNGVTSIGEDAFYGCSSLNEVHITALDVWCNIDFENKYANPVYYAKNLYLNNQLITEFVIPDGVSEIKNYTFCNNSGLTSITIPNSVTSIGECAFYDCSSLTSIEIPNSVTSIGDDAFVGCDGLTSITIPNSVTSIGDDAFYSCDGLTSITIPNSVKSIGGRAFCDCKGLTSVVIGDSVTSIGSQAFSGCSGLTSVVIPNSVTSIGNYAFDYCDGLKEVHINDLAAWCNIDFDDSYANPLYYAKNLYLNGEKVTDLVITDGVTSIGYLAFYGCSGLTSITIPNSVTSIGERAFMNCKGLTSVVIPNSVTSIGNYAFGNCSGLKTVYNFSTLTITKGSSNYGFVAYNADKVYNVANGFVESYYIFNESNDVNTLLGYLGNDTELTLPADYKGENYVIGAEAFSGNTALTSVVIPNSVTSIGRNAFDGCTGLKKVELNCKTVDDWFRSNKSIEEVVIGDSVTSIESSAFSSCSGLTSITVDSGNTVYDSRENCNAIIKTATNTLVVGCKNTIIPNSVISIGDMAFSNCSGLTSVVIPNSVTSIEGWAFYGCSGLTSITIPNSVTSIEGWAFSNCTGLTSVTIPNSVTSIGWSAFEFCDGLTSVTIPNSVISIGDMAFSNCSGLTSVVIPNSVTSIGERAFYSCSGLTSITIPNSVRSIGNDAFYDCTGLKTVYNFSILTFTKGSTDYGYVAYYADKVYNTFVVPEERKYYKIKNVATGLYLQVSGNNTNMTLQEKSDAKLQIFTLEDAGEGKFYIKSTDADNCYYAHATTWNFNATTNANNKTPFTIALLDGETNIYTLYQNVTENVGLAGTDSSNAGAFVFCDKRAENNGKWAFEVFSDEVRIAAAMAPLENTIANAESVLKTRAQLLTNDEKKAISEAVQTAKDEKGNTNADVTAEIARLTALSEMVNNAVGDAIYVNAIDEISNAVCYTVSTESRGAWYSEASNLNSTGKLNIAYNITDNKQQFAFIKSPTTGNYYLYSVSEAKFVSKNGDYTTLTETPVQTITFLTGERTASYPWIIALNTADGEKQIAVSNTFEYGIITFYNDLTDAGNTVRLEKVATFDATAALALIDAYENGETAIEEVNVENVNVIIYDLQGLRVKEITEGGIYIINGKKVLVK